MTERGRPEKADPSFRYAHPGLKSGAATFNFRGCHFTFRGRERVRDDNAGEAEFAELEIRPRRSAAATFGEGWMARGVAATEARPKTGVVGLKPGPYKKKGESVMSDLMCDAQKQVPHPRSQTARAGSG